jgi:aminoglycoside phosphotransferase (APT) family kinase protein
MTAASEISGNTGDGAGPAPVAPAARAALPADVLRWVAGVAGGGDITVLRGLRGGSSPWLMQAGPHQVVLRTGEPAYAHWFETEVAGLRLAAANGIPVPRLLGHDDGAAAGCPVVLTSCLPGASAIPPEPRPARLHALGAVAARLHAVPRQPSADLPRRDHPIGIADFVQLRAGHDVGPLQREAASILATARPSDDRTVFVHGDLWQGNTMWEGDVLSGLIDWDCAGVGPPGVDLGSLRMDVTFCYGPAAADELLAGYEQEAGQAAADIPYWDAVAALATPPGLGWFPETISAQGRQDLTRELLLERHAGFLDRALVRLR